MTREVRPAPMRPHDIARLTAAGDPRVAPDGRRVAYVLTAVDLDANEYRSRIWLADVPGDVAPRPVTAGAARDRSPRWSPDGRFLAFVSHRGDDGSTLHVLTVDGPGETATLAEWPEEIEDLAWSPDGTLLSFSARVADEARARSVPPKDQPPRRITRFFSRLDGVGWRVGRERQVFVVAADGSGRPRPLTAGPFETAGLAWSPDGAAVAFASARHDTWDLDRAVDLFTVAVTSHDTPAGTTRITPTGLAHGRPSWSPDGSRLACLVHDPAVYPSHEQVAVVDLAATTELRVLTAGLDRQCAPFLPGGREPLWDGDDLLFAVEDAGNVHLYRVPSNGCGSPRLLVGGVRQVTGWDVAGGTLAFTATTATDLPELFVARSDGSGERPLTATGRAFARVCRTVEPEPFVAVAPDGERVDAWVLRPPSFEPGARYPALLNIHGGPFTQYGNRFFDEFQVQAGAGFVVLYANPRGSSGYSERWGQAIRGTRAQPGSGSGWGTVDYLDLMAVVDEALRRFPFVDPERLGVLGGSYGGFMTNWIVAHTDRFDAACSERAANNLASMEHSSDIATSFAAWFGASHLDEPASYAAMSPVAYADAIHTPLLILHAEDDLRCPISQAEELFVALRLRGREVEFVRFPGEGHELSRSGSPRHRVQRMEIILEFFDARLRPGNAGAASAVPQPR